MSKKHQKQVTIKFPEQKQVDVGMEPSKANQTRYHNTFTPSLHALVYIQKTILWLLIHESYLSRKVEVEVEVEAAAEEAAAQETVVQESVAEAAE